MNDKKSKRKKGPVQPTIFESILNRLMNILTKKNTSKQKNGAQMIPCEIQNGTYDMTNKIKTHK